MTCPTCLWRETRHTRHRSGQVLTALVCRRWAKPAVNPPQCAQFFPKPKADGAGKP